jgi:hypothetical protein
MAGPVIERARELLVVPVLGCVILASFCCMLHRVRMMAVGDMGMMPCQFMIACLVVFGSFAMMSSRLLVMVRCFLVVGRALMRCHTALRLVVEKQA